MRTSLIIGAATLTVGAGCALAGAAAANGEPHRAPVRAQTVHLRVVERATTDTVVDNAPAGDSRGDLLAFANKVYDKSNTHRVGRDNGSCVRTAPGRAYECEWTLSLARGSVVVQGPFHDVGDSVLAVTGGTGRYRSASGQMRLHPRNAQGTAYDFRYSIRIGPRRA